MGVELEKLIERNIDRFNTIQSTVKRQHYREKDQLIFESFQKHLDYVTRHQQNLMNYSPPEKSVFERFITTTLEKFRSDFENSIQTYHEPFSLFVVGNGNYGKSTLINSLMGEEVAEANILPKTWKVDFFRADLKKDEVSIKYKDLTTRCVTLNEAKRLIEVEETSRKESEKKIKQLLNQFKETKPDIKAIKEKEQELLIHHLYHSPIIEVHWPVKQNRFSSKFYIVDTPGLNQKLDGIVKASIKDYYHKADGVVWMLDATVISAKNSSQLLEEIHETIATVGESKGEIIGVLNRIDLIKTEEKQKQIIEEANRLFGEFFSVIIPYSSKLAFEGKRDGDQEKLKKSFSNQFEQTLFDRFTENHYTLKVKSKEFSLHSYHKFLLTDSLEFLREFRNYRTELINDHRSYQSELTTLKKQTENHIQRFVKSMTDKLNGNIANRGDVFFDLKDQQARDRYLKEKLFEVDMINTEMKKLKQNYTSQLQLIEKRFLQVIVYTEFKYLHQHTLQHNTQFSVMTINVGSSDYTVNSSEMNIGIGVAAALTAGAILGPLGMVVGGLAGWAFKSYQRGKLITQLEDKAEEFIIGLSKDLTEFMEKNMDQVHLNLATNQFRSFSGLYDLNYFDTNDKLFKQEYDKNKAFTKLNTFEDEMVEWNEEIQQAINYQLSHPLQYIKEGEL